MAPRWLDLVVLLDFDRTGAMLELIKKTHSADPKECCRAMFQHWLDGNGVRPCSWHKLIELLKDCDHEALAQDIQDALGKEQVQT